MSEIFNLQDIEKMCKASKSIDQTSYEAVLRAAENIQRCKQQETTKCLSFCQSGQTSGAKDPTYMASSKNKILYTNNTL